MCTYTQRRGSLCLLYPGLSDALRTREAFREEFVKVGIVYIANIFAFLQSPCPVPH